MPTFTTELREYFQKKFEEFYDDCYIVNRTLENKHASQILSWVSLEDAKKMVDFLFEYWHEIRNQLKITGPLTLSLIASASWFTTFREIMKAGVSSSTKHRFSDDDSKEAGW